MATISHDIADEDWSSGRGEFMVLMIEKHHRLQFPPTPAHATEALVSICWVIKTYKDRKGKYGRWLVELFVDGININKQLITEGLAKVYE